VPINKIAFGVFLVPGMPAVAIAAALVGTVPLLMQQPKELTAALVAYYAARTSAGSGLQFILHPSGTDGRALSENGRSPQTGRPTGLSQKRSAPA
jgi:hypothetical protein